MMTIEMKFENELRAKSEISKKEYKYNPTYFNQMLEKYGGVQTAKRLIEKAIRTGNPSHGFTTMLLRDLLDLTMEDSVSKEEYSALFTQEEIGYCKKVLGR